MPSAVLEVPKATVLAACAIGSAAWAEFDSVGPNTSSTLSWKISFLKTLMASSFLPCSSSITNCSLSPLMPPAALISSSASWKPLRMEMPYCAAPPDRASAAPSLISAALALKVAASAHARSEVVKGFCLILESFGMHVERSGGISLHLGTSSCACCFEPRVNTHQQTQSQPDTMLQNRLILSTTV